jgi:2-polyprenyl-3-methyl-5-hydroxy-6-metoxy-1,4-benzoquinol methylase
MVSRAEEDLERLRQLPGASPSKSTMAAEEVSHNADNTKHYEDVAAGYHNAFCYVKESPMERWKLETVCRGLGPMDAETCRIADIGGGTGRMLSLVQQELGLKQPLTCVDISAEMLAEAEKENVEMITKCTDALSFASSTSAESYDRFLIMETIHHIANEDLEKLYADLLNGLSSGGVCLTITRDQNPQRYPFFEKANETWIANQSHWSIYSDAMKAAGFVDVAMDMCEYPISLPKTQWLSMVGNRFWSTFSNFTDAELEAGLAEIDEKYPADEEGLIHYKDAYILVVGTKA